MTQWTRNHRGPMQVDRAKGIITCRSCGDSIDDTELEHAYDWLVGSHTYDLDRGIEVADFFKKECKRYIPPVGVWDKLRKVFA